MNKRRNDDFYDDRQHKKSRNEPKDIPPEEKLDFLIKRVGEKSTDSLESNLDTLAGVLEADLPTYKKKILGLLGECVVRMPEKMTIYATLIGLLNARNYNFGGECIELLSKNLKDALKACEFESARKMVLCFADLVNCYVISASSMINLLENFVEVSWEEGIPQVRSDWYVYAVLSALPLVGKELHEKKDVELDHLLKAVDNYCAKRKKNHVTGLKVWSHDLPHPQEEYLDCLWAQICKLRTDKWVERHIYRLYLSFDHVLCEALQHDLPGISPPPHQSDTLYPYPSVVFRIFDYTDCSEGPLLPGAHSIERFLIEEQVRRVIQHHYLDRKECAAQLLMFPNKPKIPLDYIIVEVIFSEMLNLPTSPHIEIVYGSLLLDLCKLQPSTMPQVLAQTVELLFERLDSMNIDCIERFCSWFAYHLNNFQFRWSWDDWCIAAALDPLHPKHKFISETLQKCLRLSYHERLGEIVPAKLAPLIPPKPQPDFKYGKEGAESLPGFQIATQLNVAFKDKLPTEQIVLLLEDVPNSMMDDDGGSSLHNPLKIDIFIQSLLNYASTSFTHTFTAISKFFDVIKSLTVTEEAQICFLRSIFELWNSHQQLMCVLINKLLKTEIVACCAVANWIFSKDMSQEFTKLYIWEILHLTIQNMVRNVQKHQQELDIAREKLDKEDDDDEVTVEMVEKMEEQLESAQSDQKNLFLIIFQRFIMILTEHIARCELEGKDFKDYWFTWTIGRLQQVFHQHHRHVFKYVSTLETLLFTADVDPNILSIFQQFRALRE